MSTVISYIKHSFKAHSRHGIHSPFVYHFAESFIFRPQDKAFFKEIERSAKNKTKLNHPLEWLRNKSCLRLLGRLVKYHKYNHISFLDCVNDENVKEYLLHVNPSLIITKDEFVQADMIILDQLSGLKRISENDSIFKTINRMGVLVFRGILQNKEAKNYWNKLVQDKQSAVSINMFFIHFIFPRRAQAKQHFDIRFRLF